MTASPTAIYPSSHRPSAAGPDKELSADAFMLPFSYFTGLEFASIGQQCASVSPKLYTVHWSLMVKFLVDELLAHDEGLDRDILARALVNQFDIVGDAVDGHAAVYAFVHGYGPLEDFKRRLQLVADSPDNGMSNR